jgi:hypothetical protein
VEVGSTLASASWNGKGLVQSVTIILAKPVQAVALLMVLRPALVRMVLKGMAILMEMATETLGTV